MSTNSARLHLMQNRLTNLISIRNHYNWLKQQPDNYLHGAGIKSEEELAAEISRLRISVGRELLKKHLKGA